MPLLLKKDFGHKGVAAVLDKSQPVNPALFIRQPRPHIKNIAANIDL